LPRRAGPVAASSTSAPAPSAAAIGFDERHPGFDEGPGADAPFPPGPERLEGLGMMSHMKDAPPPPETRIVHSRRVACDGDEGALGHPRVWLQIDARGHVDCPYCDRRFVLEGDGSDHH
jgi:uncharacterized Zn-finger protein